MTAGAMYLHPKTNEPLEDPYDRGFWARDTGEPTPVRGDPERQRFLHGLAVRRDEERRREERRG